MALIDVPSLKTLDLQYLTYQHDDSLQGLLDICPVLEDLSVNFCEEQHNIPSLKYFKLVDWNYWRHDDIEIKDMPKLEESICECCILCSQECHWIHHICQASYYMLRDPKKWSVFDLVYSGGFVFNQLKHLKQCVCKKNSSHLLDQLLKDSPNLRVLDISHMERHGYDGLNEMVCWNQPSPVPECLLSSLQILNWSRYFGRPQDRDIAVYILKHARRLNKAKIIADTMEHNVQNLEMITELAFSSRASSRCELVFVKQGKEDLMW
ncbi:FBD-associated F-box protein At5g38590 [Raphanus sativus]|uniref:FBD-associated F-box protein At5g38590 n=1 Tax=Raphanus sativus TaxID=3726 RepID=A0A6J0MQY8_RAPSA|nr:FBD-associated F-box protein At5g38590 [Raphanus sativus]